MPDHALIPSETFGKWFNFFILWGHGRTGLMIASRAFWDAQLPSPVQWCWPRRQASQNLALHRPVVCKAKHCPWSCTNSLPPKQKKRSLRGRTWLPHLGRNQSRSGQGSRTCAFGEEEEERFTRVGWIRGLHASLCPLKLPFAEEQRQARQPAVVPSSLPAFFRLQGHLVAFFPATTLSASIPAQRSRQPFP